MPDPNMELAFLFAKELGPAAALPAPLTNLETMTQMLLNINGGLSEEPYHQPLGQPGLWVPLGAFLLVARRIRDLAAATPDYMPGLDPLQRVNVALRLWAGCLDAAKIVSDETSEGEKDAETRKEEIQLILARVKECTIYTAGVPAGPAVRKHRHQAVVYDGIEDYRDSLFRDPPA